MQVLGVESMDLMAEAWKLATQRVWAFEPEHLYLFREREGCLELKRQDLTFSVSRSCVSCISISVHWHFISHSSSKARPWALMTRPTHHDFLCEAHDLSRKGKCRLPGLATSHRTLEVFACPESAFSIEKEPTIYFWLFSLWHSIKVACVFHLSVSSWRFDESKPSRLRKGTQKVSLDSFGWVLGSLFSHHSNLSPFLHTPLIQAHMNL